jgi:hypothetical protein
MTECTYVAQEYLQFSTTENDHNRHRLYGDRAKALSTQKDKFTDAAMRKVACSGMVAGRCSVTQISRIKTQLHHFR